MKEIKKILYPTDLFTVSKAALEYALTFAKLYKAEIYVLNVLDDLCYDNLLHDTQENDDFIKSVEEIVRIELKKYLKENFKDNESIFQVIKSGDPKEEILKFSEEKQIDLIILSSDDQFVGSIDGIEDLIENLIDQSKVPVLMIDKPAYQDINKHSSVIDKEIQLYNTGLSLFN